MKAWAAGDDAAFWRLLADDVEYTVIGTTPVSGTYHSRRSFIDGALHPMTALMQQGPQLAHYDIIAEGSRVVLMWSGTNGVMKNGAPYNNDYCWVLDVTDGKIRKVRAYLDTELVNQLFNQTTK